MSRSDPGVVGACDGTRRTCFAVTSSLRADAAIAVLIIGTLNVIWGVAALSDKEFFHEDSLLFASLQTWGWIYIVLGGVQIVVAMLVMGGRTIGYVIGMFGSFLALIAEFLSVGAYPIWSVMLIALNFFIIFVLATNLEE